MPRKAQEDKIDGWVQMQFDVDLAGEPVNAKVLDGDPKGLFDQTGIDSVMGSKFRTSQGRIGCVQVITFKFS
jgi:outer membrane biosynthesis protein TonB